MIEQRIECTQCGKAYPVGHQDGCVCGGNTWEKIYTVRVPKPVTKTLADAAAEKAKLANAHRMPNVFEIVSAAVTAATRYVPATSPTLTMTDVLNALKAAGTQASHASSEVGPTTTLPGCQRTAEICKLSFPFTVGDEFCELNLTVDLRRPKEQKPIYGQSIVGQLFKKWYYEEMAKRTVEEQVKFLESVSPFPVDFNMWNHAVIAPTKYPLVDDQGRHVGYANEFSHKNESLANWATIPNEEWGERVKQMQAHSVTPAEQQAQMQEQVAEMLATSPQGSLQVLPLPVTYEPLVVDEKEIEQLKAQNDLLNQGMIALLKDAGIPPELVGLKQEADAAGIPFLHIPGVGVSIGHTPAVLNGKFDDEDDDPKPVIVNG